MDHDISCVNMKEEGEGHSFSGSTSSYYWCV